MTSDGDTMILCERCGRPVASRSPLGVLRVKHADWEVIVVSGDVQVNCGHHLLTRAPDGKRRRCGWPHRLFAQAQREPLG